MSRNDANYLVNTSIEDMRSSLECAEKNGERYSVEILKQALTIVKYRGEKTKVKILERLVRKYKQEGVTK